MSPALPREERDAIRARVDRATEGPWGHHAHTHGLPSDGPTHVCVFDPEDVPVAELDYSSWGERDAEFIAHARTDVPALLDALDAAEAEVAALREQYQDLATYRTTHTNLGLCPEGPDDPARDPDCPVCAALAAAPSETEEG